MIIFKGTLRFNLDPLNESSDETILNLLSEAGIDELIKSKIG